MIEDNGDGERETEKQMITQERKKIDDRGQMITQEKR